MLSSHLYNLYKSVLNLANFKVLECQKNWPGQGYYVKSAPSDWNRVTSSYVLAALLYVISTYALSFYRSKIILDRPNCFGWVKIVLVRSKLFWLGPHHFGQVQIRPFWTNFYNLDLSTMDQNKLDLSKTIGTRPKLFGRSKIILDP